MSASKKTENYDLPIYSENDVTSWLTDFNGAMEKIDSTLNECAVAVEGNANRINSLDTATTLTNESVKKITERVSTTETTIIELKEHDTLIDNSVNEHSKTLLAHESAITEMQTDIDGLKEIDSGEIAELKKAVDGNTIKIVEIENDINLLESGVAENSSKIDSMENKINAGVNDGTILPTMQAIYYGVNDKPEQVVSKCNYGISEDGVADITILNYKEITTTFANGFVKRDFEINFRLNDGSSSTGKPNPEITLNRKVARDSIVPTVDIMGSGVSDTPVKEYIMGNGCYQVPVESTYRSCNFETHVICDDNGYPTIICEIPTSERDGFAGIFDSVFKIQFSSMGNTL